LAASDSKAIAAIEDINMNLMSNPPFSWRSGRAESATVSTQQK
jgi:hypothetical protein